MQVPTSYAASKLTVRNILLLHTVCTSILYAPIVLIQQSKLVQTFNH